MENQEEKTKKSHEIWEENYTSGIAKAREEGIKSGVRNVAKQMKEKNMDTRIIMEITGLTEEEIKKL